jgi:uncharacterized protein YycO
VLPPGNPGVIRSGLRAIGRVFGAAVTVPVDYSELRVARPGDFILYAPDRPNPKQVAIQLSQRIRYAREHAAFTHIALLVAPDEIVDSVTSGGVAKRALTTLSERGWLRVRRARSATPAQAAAVVALALDMADENHPYNGLDALLDGLNLDLDDDWRAMLANSDMKEARYCGQVVDAAYAAKGIASVVNGARSPLPAAFSENDALFEDVPAHYPPR